MGTDGQACLCNHHPKRDTEFFQQPRKFPVRQPFERLVLKRWPKGGRLLYSRRWNSVLIPLCLGKASLVTLVPVLPFVCPLSPLPVRLGLLRGAPRSFFSLYLPCITTWGPSGCLLNAWPTTILGQQNSNPES